MKTHVANSRIEVKPITISSPTMWYRKAVDWLDRMDYYRLIVLVGTILFQGCVSAPFAMWSMDAAVGYNEIQMGVITIGSFAILVTNLSVQPMRTTIPVFVVSTVAQLAVIILNIVAIF